jgi:hypothetical protein
MFYIQHILSIFFFTPNAKNWSARWIVNNVDWQNGWKLVMSYICKTQIDFQPLIDVQSSNPHPISMSQTSVRLIYVLFSNSRIVIQFSNLWPSLIFPNQSPMRSPTYALSLTHKSAIDLYICQGHRFENTLKSDSNLR